MEQGTTYLVGKIGPKKSPMKAAQTASPRNDGTNQMIKVIASDKTKFFVSAERATACKGTYKYRDGQDVSLVGCRY